MYIKNIMKKLNIYWSRRDFRLTDNLALVTSLEKSKQENPLFLPVFILEDYMRNAETKYQFGYPPRLFLAKALPIFSENFKKFFVLKGKAADTLINIFKKLEKEFEIEIFVNEDVYIDFYKQINKLKKHNIKINVFVDQITVDKNTKSGMGNFYSIFTPF
jgi:deoxyribodipyrimidine photo-lyase